MLDHNLSPKLARAIDALSTGSRVVAKRDKFPPNTMDVDWIRALGDEGNWAVVTQDGSILTNPLELQAWREAKLTLFILAKGWRGLEHWPKAAKLVGVWPTIEHHALTVTAGAAYSVRLNGKLDVLQSL